MLDFLLVLGQIPGTDVQITFYEYAAVILILAAVIFRRQLKSYVLTQKKAFIDYLKHKYWQRRQLSLPV